VPDLDRKIAVGAFWNLLNLFFSRGSSTIFMLLLARLLAPEAFGLLAMATIVFELSNAFVNAGLGTALIRSETVSDADLDTVFYTNMMMSVFAYFVIFLSAPLLAAYFGHSELTELVRVMGLVVFVNATKVVQSAIFSRQMDFKVLMKAGVVSTILSGCLAVVAAFMGWGVWSLVLQMLSSALISASLLWVLSSWRPSLYFSVESFNRLFGFGRNLLLEGLLNVLFQNSYVVVLGRYFSPEVTGLYFLAKRISVLASEQPAAAVQQATLPGLATLLDRPCALLQKYRQVMQLMMFLVAPIMAVLAGTAPVFFDLAFDDRWLGAAQILQPLCLVGLLFPMHALNVNLLLVTGRSDLALKVGVLKRCIGLALLICAIPYGVMGVVASQVIASFINLVPNTFYAARLVGYSFYDQVRDVFKPILAAGAAFVCIQSMILIDMNSLLWTLICYFIIGFTAYLFASLVLRAEGLMIVLEKISRRFLRRV
jgi:lipopolysaccharide exporter